MPSPTLAPPTPASPAVHSSSCAPIDLRDPEGNRVDLTGTWREPSGGPVYYVYQDGDCVWYVGGFAPSDAEQDWGPLGLFTITYQGRIDATYTVVGRWAVVRMAGNSFGGNMWHDKTWTVEFEAAPEGHKAVLTSPADDAGSVAATRLDKLSDDVIEP